MTQRRARGGRHAEPPSASRSLLPAASIAASRPSPRLARRAIGDELVQQRGELPLDLDHLAGPVEPALERADPATQAQVLARADRRAAGSAPWPGPRAPRGPAACATRRRATSTGLPAGAALPSPFRSSRSHSVRISPLCWAEYVLGRFARSGTSGSGAASPCACPRPACLAAVVVITVRVSLPALRSSIRALILPHGRLTRRGSEWSRHGGASVPCLVRQSILLAESVEALTPVPEGP